MTQIELIKEKTDEELIIILCRSEEYQPAFIELVINELREFRNIQAYKDFFESKSEEELICFRDKEYSHSEKFVEFAKKELKERKIFLDNKDAKACAFYKQPDCLGQTIPSIPLERSFFSSEQTDYLPADSVESSTSPTSNLSNEEAVNQVYEFAANLIFKEKKSNQDVINELVNSGIDTENAEIVVNNLLSSRNESANKNMLYGALWCIGGTIATVADFGYIFWGAIVFGAIQFFTGLAKRSRH